MNKYKFLCLIVFVFIGVTLFAKKAPTVAAKLPDNLKEVVMNQIDYPDFAQKDLINGYVMMKICITDASLLKIVDLSSTNQALGEYVESCLSSLYIEKPGCKANQIFYLKVKFNLLRQ